VHLLRGDVRKAYELFQQLLRLAPNVDDPAPLAQVRHALGATSYWMGEYSFAREHLENAIILYDPEPHGPLIFRYIGVDGPVRSRSYLAMALWQLGYPEQALKRGDEALALARRLSHPFSLAFAQNIAGGILHQLRREPRAAQETADSTIALSIEHGFADPLAYATVMRGWATAEQGCDEEGIAQIRDGLAAGHATGSELLLPYHLCLLAEVCKKAGQFEEGLRALKEALAAADERGNRASEAEIHRLKGELLLKQEDSNAAEAQSCFERAIEIARKQSAKSLELRATTSLSRLLAQRGRRDEARKMLAEIYNWFTEGFDTADLKEAKALLEELRT
jgi:predicted ATPase